MARVINLTLPLYPHMPVGNVWAHDTPVQIEPIVTYEQNEALLEAVSLHSETGTRLMMAACYDPDASKIDEIDLSRLINRPTVVIDIPKGPQEQITAKDVDERVGPDQEYRRGDALLIRTGWGDGERYRKLGDDYAIKTPHFSDDGAYRLADVMKERDTDTLAIDVAYIGNCGRTYMLKEWVSLPPWQRPPWPSPQAKIYLRTYDRSRDEVDWSASRPLHYNGFVLAALCNAGKISRKRIKISALPFFVKGAPGAPVTVVAIED